MGKRSTSHKGKNIGNDNRLIIIYVMTVTIVMLASLRSGAFFTQFEKIEIKNAYTIYSEGKYILNVEYVNSGSMPTSIESVSLNNMSYASYMPALTLGKAFGTLPSPCDADIPMTGIITIQEGTIDADGNKLVEGLAIIVKLHTSNGRDYTTVVRLEGGSGITSVDDSNPISPLTNSLDVKVDGIIEPNTENGMNGSINMEDMNSMPRLHVEGAHIVDSYGKDLSLRGFNVDVRNVPQASEADIAWITSKGFNCIRAIIYAESDGPDTRWDRLDNVVNWCEKYGCYIIIDLHQYGQSPYFNLGTRNGIGFPTRFYSYYDPNNYWSVIVDIHDGDWSHLVDPSTGENLWDYIKWWWSQVAQRYVGRTVIAGYELINEMYLQTSMYDELFNMIKTYDSNVIGFYCVPNSHSWASGMTKQNQTNVVWTPHCYPKRQDGTYCMVNYDHAVDYVSLQSKISDVISIFQNTYGAPVWWGEIDCHDADNQTDVIYVDDCLSIIESLGQSNWAYWSYAKVDGGTFPRDATGNDKVVVSVLQSHIAH